MVKLMHVCVVGAKCTGKTAILQHLALSHPPDPKSYTPTQEDTYTVQVDAGSSEKSRQMLIMHDTAGVPTDAPELKRSYLQAADAFIFVYDVSSAVSFEAVDHLKKFIEKQFAKDKQHVPMLVLGNVRDSIQRKISVEFALTWAQREKVKLYEVNAAERQTLVEPIVYLGGALFHPIKESRFSLHKKLKPAEKQGAAILMDI